MSGEITNLSIGSIRFTGPTVRHMNAIKGDRGDRGDDCDELKAENLRFSKVSFNGGLLQMLPPLCFEELQHANSAIISEAGNSPLPIEDSDLKEAAAGQKTKQEGLDEDQANSAKTAKKLKKGNCKSQKAKADSKM
ncbi:hypothetical protein RP20_CCG015065 [Aedes albopictus]|nr:hypothetical protein RP20_CCG015065 [Aedes albopictus]